MGLSAQREDQRGHGGDRQRLADLAPGGDVTQSEGDDPNQRIGDRKTPFACESAAVTEDQARQRGERNDGGQKIRDVPGESAGEANQTKCSEPAHPASIDRIPLAPTAFDADQDANCQRGRQGTQQFSVRHVHGVALSGSRLIEWWTVWAHGTACTLAPTPFQTCRMNQRGAIYSPCLSIVSVRRRNTKWGLSSRRRHGNPYLFQ